MSKGIPRLGNKALSYAQLDLKIKAMQKTIAKDRLADEIKYKSLETFTALLAAFAGHDIKNAIHNMDGVVSLLSVETITEPDIQLIKECAARLRESLREFINVGIPRDTETIEPFEISRLVSSLDTLHRHILKGERIHYKTIFRIEKSTLIKQNFHWLVQVFNNLFINATTALKKTTDKKLQLSIDCIEDTITVLLSDNGVGIPLENRKRIFEPYFTTTGGSGIGLAHVRSVMKQLNGKVELVEEPGFTTTVKVTFPLICDTPS